MDKIDYRKKYHDFYSPPTNEVQEITIPAWQFAVVDGKGTPEGPDASPEFQNAIGALYGVTYTLKFTRKKAGIKPDYTIAPLEGLWWMASGEEFDMKRAGDWRWTLMIFQPEFIEQSEFNEAIGQLKKKKPNPALDSLRLEKFEEGKVVQIMHIGSYDAEGPNIKKLEDYTKANGLTFRGKHHEIYLGDPRRAKPEKLRTILRHPVE